MKRKSKRPNDFARPKEFDFSNGVVGKYAWRYRLGAKVILSDERKTGERKAPVGSKRSKV